METSAIPWAEPRKPGGPESASLRRKIDCFHRSLKIDSDRVGSRLLVAPAVPMATISDHPCLQHHHKF